MSATITPRQGQTIVAATWTRERRGGASPDCSHLVHEVYSIAGFRYPYTDSFDLYAGIENFVRVTRPQPGDLIVWHGHVGIVINPTEHSFYSSLRSGLGTDFYDALYWKGRGPARFYRYLRAAETKLILGNYDAPSDDAAVEIPSSILVATAHRIPTEVDVSEAVSELNNASASILSRHDLTEFNRKVVIYDELGVQHVDVKGQQLSATIRIDSRVALTAQGIERPPTHQEIRWKLVRTTQGWEALAQPDCVYVPRDMAIHALAIRLALLTQDARVAQTDADLSEQTRIVRILSILSAI